MTFADLKKLAYCPIYRPIILFSKQTIEACMNFPNMLCVFLFIFSYTFYLTFLLPKRKLPSAGLCNTHIIGVEGVSPVPSLLFEFSFIAQIPVD